MKYLVNIFIALIFIVGSYSIGKYACEEQNKANMKKLKNQTENMEKSLKGLKDSIKRLNEKILILDLKFPIKGSSKSSKS